jgi:molecular chaperone DnaJ
MSKRDPYEVLGVDRTADADTIKKAYRKLAMQFHPDKNPGNKEAEESFKEAASAYEILSNAQKRAQYDRFGHAAFGQAAGGAGFQDINDVFSNFSDIFSEFFGSGTGFGGAAQERRKRPRRGADLRYITEISLREVIEGVEKDIKFDTEESCEDCEGSGAAEGSKPVTCPMCQGRGQVVRSQGFFQMATTCSNCRGEGSVISNPCKTCRGQGRTKVSRKIRVTIPAGVDSGTRLRVTEEGEGGFLGGPSGDLFVEVHVKEDPRFERDQFDLHTRSKFHFLQLILGAEVEVQSVTGSVKVEVPSGTQPGERLRIPNEGIPSLKGSRRGDLYIHVDVEIPSKISKEEEALLRDLAQKQGVDCKASKAGFWGRKKS